MAYSTLCATTEPAPPPVSITEREREVLTWIDEEGETGIQAIKESFSIG